MSELIQNGASLIQQRTDAYGAKRYTISPKLDTTGMDPSEYAKSVGDVRRAEAKNYKDKVDDNLKHITKLQELKKHTTTVRNFSESLGNYLGANTKVPNLWKEKMPSIVSSSGEKADHLVHLTATKEANIRDFKIEILQMAKADSLQSTNAFASKTAGLGISGTLTIGGTNVTITDGTSGTVNMNLEDISNLVNSTFSTKVRMDVFSLDGTTYGWQITALDLSKPVDLTGTSQTLLNGLFIPKDPLDATLARITSTDALTLKFKYNDQLMSRSGSNVISDLIPNVTLEIKGENTGALLSKIDYARQTVVDGFSEFVNAYNGLRAFSREQTAFEADKTTPKEGAHLHKSSILKRQLFDMENILSTWVEGLSSTNPNTIQGIGLSIGQSIIGGNQQITSDLSGDLFLDLIKLDQMIGGDKIHQVLAVVGNNVSSTNDYFRVFSIPDFMKNNAIAGVPVTVSLQKQNGTLKATLSATINTVMTNVDGEYKEGGLINGPKNTPFEGFTIACKTDKVSALIDNGPALSTTVTSTQGVLTRLEKTLDSYLAFQTGIVDQEIQRLEQENIKNNERSEKLELQARIEEERIIKQFQYIREIERSYLSMMEMMDSLMDLMASKK